MSTTGHESEAINVGGLKASLQKMKTDIVDPKYVKPSTGIPKSDLASDVQTSLGKADTALLLNPIELSSLSHDYTFKQNDCIMVGSVLYKCTVASTTKPPFNFVFDANNKIVVDRINGVDSVVCDSTTLNTGWTAFLDINDRYYLEQRLLSKADKATTLAGYGIADAYTKTQIDALTRHTRLTDFDLNVLKQAVAAQNLEKYGLKVGDQKTINGHTYVIAGLNPFKGADAVTQNHVGLIVFTDLNTKWRASGKTYADDGSGGDAESDLRSYLINTVLPLVRTDLGTANLIGHTKNLANAVNADAPCRLAFNDDGSISTGASSGKSIYQNEYISALSEIQVYGSVVYSSSGHDAGEACRQLDVFRCYSFTEVLPDNSDSYWLRDVVGKKYAAIMKPDGDSGYMLVNYSIPCVAALVLFH